MSKGVSKAWLFIFWIFSLLALIGVMFWVQHFAYNGKHEIYDPYWVVPVQWFLFIIAIGFGIACVALLIFPKEWFVKWAETEHNKIKNI